MIMETLSLLMEVLLRQPKALAVMQVQLVCVAEAKEELLKATNGIIFNHFYRKTQRRTVNYVRKAWS